MVALEQNAQPLYRPPLAVVVTVVIPVLGFVVIIAVPDQILVGCIEVVPAGEGPRCQADLLAVEVQLRVVGDVAAEAAQNSSETAQTSVFYGFG